VTAQGLQAIRIVGGVVPPSLLARIQAGEVDNPISLSPTSYHLAGRETIGDATSRAWSYLRGAWTAWREYAAAQPPGGAGTGATRERWLLVLLRELGYGHVPAVPGGYLIEGLEYPISHAWQHVPMHLLGPGADLDHRNPGVAGAARAPQAMVQELLNRDDTRLWAILSNGVRLRLLRDSTALAGSAYLEFDLETIFSGELYPEFRLMWQLCHVSRVEKRGGPDASAADCWLEAWRNEAVEAGARALDRLRDGVEQALTALGSGFLRHPSNESLRNALRDGRLTTTQYHRALLRLVYRLLFCFVAEDRDALLSPSAGAQQRERYAQYFSTARLRRLARVRAGGPHGDLWHAQRLVLSALGNHGHNGLGLPGLAGLFDPDPRVPVIDGTSHQDLLLGCSLANSDLLKAVRHLAWLRVPRRPIQPVDYRHLGTEELGSVYESLLELRPQLDLEDRSFHLHNLAGNERKTTGSYYTPPGLVSALLDTALDPLLDHAVKNAADQADAEQRLLALSVCDPACGSGHFLVAAARRIAQRLAQLRSGEDEPTPPEVQHALREAAGRCLYGVDVNDLAAELAKVSLWLEALEPGKPLSFLDARIRVGNSLLGTTPMLLQASVPDAAFKELEGDDKQYAARVRRRNRAESTGQGVLVLGEMSNKPLAADRAKVLSLTDDVDEVRHQARQWDAYERSTGYLATKAHTDAWCAAFVWPLQPGAPEPPTNGVLHLISENPADPHVAQTVKEVERLTDEFRFFQWHLEFPEVFHVDSDEAGTDAPQGWAGGFSCLVGNPPWERVKLQEQEFFASRDPEIGTAPNAATRRRLIAALARSSSSADRALHAEFLAARRHAEGESAILRTSGRYPLAGRGDVNTYAVFAELFRTLSGPDGRSGVIVPTGIATDATTQHFFKDLVDEHSLVALYDFENRTGLFPAVDSRMKFCLLTMAGREEREDAASFAFFLHDPELVSASEFSLAPEEIALLNPNTGTCPIFRSRRDAEITLNIYRRVPVLVREDDANGNPWQITFVRMFDMTNDASSFYMRDQLEAEGWRLQGNAFVKSSERMLPLYQGMMLDLFDHRASDIIRSATADKRPNQPVAIDLAGHEDPSRVAFPVYWVKESACSELSREWQVGFSSITSPTNERTFFLTVFPKSGVGNSVPLVQGLSSAADAACLVAITSSFALDFVARQKVGGTNLNFFIVKQLPVFLRSKLAEVANWDENSTIASWIVDRIIELTYTAWDMEPFARDLGDGGPPFRWNPERRVLLRAELDAAFFHLYGVCRDDTYYILDTFPIVQRKEEERYGEFRSKRLILEIYDAIQKAIETRAPYQTIVDPLPGQGPRHPERPRETA
jgi:hypothetical protein